MIAVVAAGLSPAADAWAADASEIQDMRREVAQMRAQVLALQSAVLEATELERQRSAAMNKAIKELASVTAPAPAAPPPPAPSTEPASEPRPASSPSVRPASGDEKPKSTRQRRHRRSGRSRH